MLRTRSSREPTVRDAPASLLDDPLRLPTNSQCFHQPTPFSVRTWRPHGRLSLPTSQSPLNQNWSRCSHVVVWWFSMSQVAAPPLEHDEFSVTNRSERRSKQSCKGRTMNVTIQTETYFGRSGLRVVYIRVALLLVMSSE